MSLARLAPLMRLRSPPISCCSAPLQSRRQSTRLAWHLPHLCLRRRLHHRRLLHRHLRLRLCSPPQVRHRRTRLSTRQSLRRFSTAILCLVLPLHSLVLRLPLRLLRLPRTCGTSAPRICSSPPAWLHRRVRSRPSMSKLPLRHRWWRALLPLQALPSVAVPSAFGSFSLRWVLASDASRRATRRARRL